MWVKAVMIVMIAIWIVTTEKKIMKNTMIKTLKKRRPKKKIINNASRIRNIL